MKDKLGEESIGHCIPNNPYSSAGLIDSLEDANVHRVEHGIAQLKGTKPMS
jgi:hypothetical protein